MAIMYPDKPHEFPPNSREGIMFDCLKKLSNEYYVFHSFKIVNVIEDTIFESETDFVIFNPAKGILCLEAKAGHVKYEEGEWKYGSGHIMGHGGPYRQAASGKWKLRDFIKSRGLDYILGRCKLLHAVWFPSISESDVRGMRLPTESDKALIMTKEALADPQPYLERILSMELPNGKQTN